MMKHKKWIVGIVCIIFLLISFIIRLSNNNSKMIEVLNLEDEGASILNDITPFDWDDMYAFPPYITENAIEETIGFSDIRIVSSLSEGMNQVIFVKDDKIVAYYNGYPTDDGVYFVIPEWPYHCTYEERIHINILHEKAFTTITMIQ